MEEVFGTNLASTESGEGVVGAACGDSEDERVARLSEEGPAVGAADGAAMDDRMASLAYTVHRQPLNREVLYAILSLCTTEREVGFVEEAVGAMPEFGQATQNPFRLISFLVTHEGLSLIQRDADGQPIDEARKEGLDEDALDDLVATESVVTTEVGRRLLEFAAPQRRMGLLLEAAPERRDTYAELLEFIDAQRPSYGEVKELLAGREVLRAFLDGHWVDMQPSVFLDKLEGAGMIRWENGWALTEEGRVVLDQLKGTADGC